MEEERKKRSALEQELKEMKNEMLEEKEERRRLLEILAVDRQARAELERKVALLIEKSA